MKIKLNIYRYDPLKDKESYMQLYNVESNPTDRVLDALVYISHNEDGTLAFRKSCAHGVCGSDAMIINGKERLACKTLVRDVADSDGDTITLEPLRHMGVSKDLVVDQSAVMDKFRHVSPFLIPREPAPENREYFQSPENRQLIDDSTKCINCGACYSACPVLDTNPNFLGPMALVVAARFVFDNRDKGFEERLSVLDHPDAVWSCDNHYECTKVCPRGIKITKLINLTKKAIKKYKEEANENS